MQPFAISCSVSPVVAQCTTNSSPGVQGKLCRTLNSTSARCKSELQGAKTVIRFGFLGGASHVSRPNSWLHAMPSVSSKSSRHQLQQLSRRRGAVAVFNPMGNPGFALEEDEEVSPDISPSPPPTAGRIEVVVDRAAISSLDLSPAHQVLRPFTAEIGDYISAPPQPPTALFDSTVGFTISYQLDDPLDPRELSELPDVRLWFVRLDVAYPWLPAVLDWRAGELARYAAMLVPHQMSKRHGLIFNPEALELWSMKKYFLVFDWLKARGVQRPDARVKDMMKMLGFSISDNLYEAMLNEKKP